MDREYVENEISREITELLRDIKAFIYMFGVARVRIYKKIRNTKIIYLTLVNTIR